MRVPQILKVTDTCVYVTVGYAGGSLGEDFIGMLDRASEYVTGNPDLSAANRLIASTWLELIRSPTPVSVRAFYEAVRSDDGTRGGANTLRVLLRVLQVLKQEDRERFSVMPDWASVCPNRDCRRHVSTTNAPPQLFFDYHRADYDYTAPWVDVCGRPYEDFGPAIAKGSPREGICKGCKEPLRSTSPDGKLELKEKLLHPLGIGSPEKPRYVNVHYACPPEIVDETGAKRPDVAALNRMKASFWAFQRRIGWTRR